MKDYEFSSPKSEQSFPLDCNISDIFDSNEKNSPFFSDIQLDNEFNIINLDYNQSKIKTKENTDDLKAPKLNKKRGRIPSGKYKRKPHTKESNDNLRRKIKYFIIKELRIFINKKITSYYNNNKMNIKKEGILYINEKTQIYKTPKDFNIILLNKTIGEIFSDNISRRYKKIKITHNKDLINTLNNNTNGYNFKEIFDLKFIDCLEHFRGTKKNQILEGMTTFEQIKHKHKDKPDYSYYLILNNHLMSFEKLLNSNKKENRELF